MGKGQGIGYHSIGCEDLQSFFDQQAGAVMDHSSLQHNGQVAEDFLRSRLARDAAPVAANDEMAEFHDVVVLRLTRMARSAEVTAVLLGSQVLEECRQRMAAAGYDITPSWAGGAKVFVPLEQEYVEASITLQHFHIVAYSCDVERIKQALSPQCPAARARSLCRTSCSFHLLRMSNHSLSSAHCALLPVSDFLHPLTGIHDLGFRIFLYRESRLA